MVRRKGVGKFNATDLIVPAIIIGGAYFLLTKVGDLFGSDTGTNNTTVDTNTAAAAAAAAAAAQAAGSQQTLTDTTINSLANVLYQEMVQDPVDQATVLNNVIQVNTQLDWAKLYQSFGTRKANTGGMLNSCALLGIGCDSVDLVSFIKMSLDSTHRDEINSYFSAQGINATV